MTSRRVKISIAAFVLLLIAVVLLVGRFAGQSVLAKYKKELRAKGELLSFADLPPPFCTNGNPNLAKLTNAVAALRSSRRSPELKTMKFTEPGVAQPRWSDKETGAEKGDSYDWDELAQDLENNAALMEIIRQSLENPEPDTGWSSRTNPFSFSKDFNHRRTSAQWLSRATLHSLRENQFPTALTNLHALFQLVQLEKNELTLVNHMIRVAIAGMAFLTAWETLQSPDWNDSQLAQLQADLNSIDLIEAMEKGLVGERIFGLEYVQEARSQRRLTTIGPAATKPKIQERIIGTVWSAALAERDELSFLEAHQRHIEHARLLRTGKTWPEVSALLDDDWNQLDKVLASYRIYLRPLTSMGIPNVRKACLRAIQNDTQRQMVLAVVALKRYELRHGKPAAELAALVPEFLAKVPHDWMDQKPLKYRVTEKGFVLYSVGEDGRDDGGDPTPVKPLGKKDYELWDGRDAVWPEAELAKPNQ